MSFSRMDELIREKEAQLQMMLRLVHSEKCIREEILAFFGEECEDETDSFAVRFVERQMVYRLDRTTTQSYSINE